jgi:hypothetical protein
MSGIHAQIALNLDNLRSSDNARQDTAFRFFMNATNEAVDWAYEVWNDLLATLKKGDNRQRAISSQVLCNLAKSDPENRILQDLNALLLVTKDERFVTARHCMQSLWKIGVVGESQRKALVDGLVHRFDECAAEKNCTLIRYDILETLRRIYDLTADETLRTTATVLIDTEPDTKYRKKYATLWRKKA